MKCIKLYLKIIYDINNNQLNSLIYFMNYEIMNNFKFSSV